MAVTTFSRRVLSVVAGVALMAALAAVPCSAQSKSKKDKEADLKTRSVEGSVTDPDGNIINGAVVHLKNAKTLQIRSFITRERGHYYFNGLSTDVDYEMKAEHLGVFSPSKILSTFDNRKQAVMNFKVDKK